MIERIRSRASLAIALLLCGGLASSAAQAIEIAWSGFGTIGYARSNQGFHYLRWIDDGGTFNADTIGGVQADLQLAPRWSASVQLLALPALDHDSRWELKPAWAFVAWRPADGWLLRAGKFRMPAYIYSEILSVGAAHDLARLPQEMYSIAPIDETVGLSASYERALDADGDWNLTATLYGGENKTTTRGWAPNGLPGVFEAGASFLDTQVRSVGLVLDVASSVSRLRLGIHQVNVEPGRPLPETMPLVVAGPYSYYKVDPALPGPPLNMRSAFGNDLYTLGLEQRFAGGWRMTAEYARLVQHDIEFGNDVYGGYLALFKELDRFTPYLSVAKLKSTDGQLQIVRGLTGNPLPPTALGGNGTFINLAQQDVAALSFAIDQQTLALGTSFMLSGGKLKVEWAHTWINGISRMVDVPIGAAVYQDRSLNLLTINYSMLF